MTEEKFIELEMSAFCPNEYAFISIPVTDKLPDMQAVASVFNENYAGFVRWICWIILTVSGNALEGYSSDRRM